MTTKTRTAGPIPQFDNTLYYGHLKLGIIIDVMIQESSSSSALLPTIQAASPLSCLHSLLETTFVYVPWYGIISTLMPPLQLRFHIYRFIQWPFRCLQDFQVLCTWQSFSIFIKQLNRNTWIPNYYISMPTRSAPHMQYSMTAKYGNSQPCSAAIWASVYW